MFSFGITMWEILTGEEPYANLHCGAIIGKLLDGTLANLMLHYGVLRTCLELPFDDKARLYTVDNSKVAFLLLRLLQFGLAFQKLMSIDENLFVVMPYIVA